MFERNLSRNTVQTGQSTVRILRPGGTAKSGNSGLVALPMAQLDVNSNRSQEALKLRKENNQLREKISKLENQLLVLKEQHLKEIENVKTSSFQKGKEEGVNQAGEENERLYQKSIEQITQNVNTLLQGWEEEKQNLFDTMEKPVLELVNLAVEKIIGVFTEQDKKIILPVISKAIKELGESTSIVIKVNPGDYQTVDKNRSAFLSLEQSEKRVRITSDERISRGSCYLETEFSSVEVNLEKAVTDLANELKITSEAKVRQEEQNKSWSTAEIPDEPENSGNS